MAEGGEQEPVRIGGDWYEMHDPDTATAYYANTETGETRWTFPDELMTGDWVQVYDGTHDRDYWTNSRTGESQWEPPEAEREDSLDALTSGSGSKASTGPAAGEAEEQRGRATSTMVLDNPMNKARAAKVARGSTGGVDSGDAKSAAPASTTASPAKALTVSVASPLKVSTKPHSGGSSPSRNAGRASARPGGGSPRRMSSMAGASPVGKGAKTGSSKGSVLAGSGSGSGSSKSAPPSAKTSLAAKRPKYKHRRRKRDKWRAQPCSNLQQSLYTLTIFGVSFTTWQSALRLVLLLGIFLGVGEAMMETYDDRPAQILLTLAESLYVVLFTLEYVARLWSCHPLAFEEFDGTTDQQVAQASATGMKTTFYWTVYGIVWPFHVAGMMCNPVAGAEARYRFMACCGNRAKAKAYFKPAGWHEEWDRPLDYVAGCLPWHEDVAGAGAFWQRFQFATRWSSVFDLMQLLPLLIHGIAPDAVRLFDPTTQTTYLGAVFRMIRVMRVLKFIRYIPTMGKLIAGIRNVTTDLVTSTSAAVIVAVLLAAAAHAAEQHENAEFSSLPKALWGMVVTLTTVGYGDLFPTSKEGKMISGMASIAGIGLFTIPAATVARGFQQYAAQLKARREEAVARLMRLYRAKKLRLLWKRWMKQSELAAMADRMADPNSRKAQLYYRRNVARELLRLCALELGTCLETVSRAVSERQRWEGMPGLGFEVGGGVDSPPASPRRGGASPRRVSTMPKTSSTGRLFE